MDAPRLVPLDILLMVCVAPHYYRSSVKQALFGTFSSRDLPGGERAVFHPDNFTFGQPVYLSQVIATAMQVPGVEWVQPLLFQRWGQLPRDELKDGLITFDRLEITRLDNDPNAQENGQDRFRHEGWPMSTPVDSKTLDTCGCCEADVPQPKLCNRSGLRALAYRIGTHSTFLGRMLARLSHWRHFEED